MTNRKYWMDELKSSVDALEYAYTTDDDDLITTALDDVRTALYELEAAE